MSQSINVIHLRLCSFLVHQKRPEKRTSNQSPFGLQTFLILSLLAGYTDNKPWIFEPIKSCSTQLFKIKLSVGNKARIIPWIVEAPL